MLLDGHEKGGGINKMAVRLLHIYRINDIQTTCHSLLITKKAGGNMVNNNITFRNEEKCKEEHD